MGNGIDGTSYVTGNSWTTKDSGKRATFDSGMCRDTDEGKTRYWRTAIGPMLKRWALLLGRGKEKYPDVAPGVPNWTLANSEAELQRFRESAFDHFMQWFNGEVDEDHAAGVFFNINGAEYVRNKCRRKPVGLDSWVLPVEELAPVEQAK